MEINDINNGIITEVKTIVLLRKNLSRSSLSLSFDEINFTHFKYESDGTKSTTKYSQVKDLIMFVDTNGRTKMLKNRYGKIGEVK